MGEEVQTFACIVPITLRGLRLRSNPPRKGARESALFCFDLMMREAPPQFLIRNSSFIPRGGENEELRIANGELRWRFARCPSIHPRNHDSPLFERHRRRTSGEKDRPQSGA